MKKLTNEQIETIKANPILKDVFPDLFKKELPKTGFLKSINGTVVYRTGDSSGFGVGSYGNYKKEDHWSFLSKPQDWQLATKEEFLEAIKPILKEKGFVDGVKFKSPCSGHVDTYYINSFGVNSKGSIYSLNNFVLHEGEFAEIIPEFEKDDIVHVWDDEKYPCIGYFIAKKGDKFVVGFRSSKYQEQSPLVWDNCSKNEPELNTNLIIKL